jgi:hypothetical protein
MKKLFALKRLFATALSLFAIIGTTSADWNVYDCSQTPLDFGMEAGSSNTSIYNETAGVIVDPDISDNSLLNFLTVDNVAAKLYFTQSLSDSYSTDSGFTVVARVKALSDTAKVIEFELRAGFYREKIRIDSDGNFNVEKGTGEDTKIDYPAPEGTDMLDWNIYRFTFKDSTLNIWVNDVQIASNILSTNASSTSTEFTIGDSNTGSIYAAEIDWIIWDETGVYAPGEGTDYPSEISLDPLIEDDGEDDGEDEDEEDEGNWDIYDASETPEAAGFSAGSSNTNGISTIIDDSVNIGNMILDMRSGEADKWYWSTNHLTDVDPDSGFTVVYRMSGITADSASVGEMEVCAGGFRDKVRVYSNGQINIEKAGVTVDFPEGVDVMDYNVYRVTFQRDINGTDTTGYTRVWINDEFVAEGYSTETSTSNKYTIGDSNSSKSYAALIDWIIRDETGAYAPYENSNYPSTIVIDPLEGGEVEIPDMLTFDDASVAVAQMGETITANLEANAAWLLATTDTWLDITPVAGDSGVAIITITAEANTGAAPRTGTIYGLIGDEFLDELTITQEGLAVQIEALSAIASSEQLKDGVYQEAALAIDGLDSTAWVYDESIVNGESEWIKVAIPSGSEVVMVKIMEYKNNERLTSFSVDYWNGSEYVEILEQQLSPLQDLANSEVAYTLPSTVTTDTIKFNFYGNTSTTETDPSVASGWLTISELSIWGAENSTGSNSVIQDDFKVYPNPTTGLFVIENAKGADIELISILGEKMYQKSGISEKEQVNLVLPKGLYLLKVDQTVTKVLIK